MLEIANLFQYQSLYYMNDIYGSVADPDPNPHVFGPPGSGSISQRYGSGSSSCKNSKKNLDSYYFVTLFDFLSLKKDVNVPSKSNKQNFFKVSFLLAS